MAALGFVQDGRRWLSDAFSPTKGNVEVSVRFARPGGGHVGVLRSVDGTEWTPFESGTVGNLGKGTRLLVWNVSGIVPGALLRLSSTAEVSDCEWRE